MIERATRIAALVAGFISLGAGPSLAAVWSVEPAKSQIAFSGVQTGSPFHGRFERFDAKIDFDPAHPEASHLDVVVDLASAKTGDSQRDSALPGAEWFDVAHFAAARFESTAVRRTGPASYLAQGQLTLRGQTRPVALPFTVQINGKTAHAVGHVQLVRTDFGVGQGPWASGQWVALPVGVDIDLTATAR